MTDLEKLVAQVMSTAFIEPVTPGPKKAKPAKKHRLVKKLENMSEEQKGLLLLLLDNKLAQLTVKGETYVYRRTDVGWLIRSLHDNEPEHTVNLDFSACSCQDHKYRGSVCKHMSALKGVLAP